MSLDLKDIKDFFADIKFFVGAVGGAIIGVVGLLMSRKKMKKDFEVADVSMEKDRLELEVRRKELKKREEAEFEAMKAELKEVKEANRQLTLKAKQLEAKLSAYEARVIFKKDR